MTRVAIVSTLGQNLAVTTTFTCTRKHAACTYYSKNDMVISTLVYMVSSVATTKEQCVITEL